MKIGRLKVREVDPVVGHPRLRVVIGADFLRALARANLRAPRRFPLLARLFLLHLVQTRPQNAHRPQAVLELRALILAGYHDPGRAGE